MVVHHAQYTAERGFSFEIDYPKQCMGQITNDGRKSYKNPIPYGDICLSFVARHFQLTHRRAENHKHKYFGRENSSHVWTFLDHQHQYLKTQTKLKTLAK
eukprot:gb/GEZJ01007472.1/.p1 GENE.gb/GEZJ01007472.1/~~gb/GEZJ01007472.1/.p1  ORF type:complete len:100 (+),score=2.76 gb/GEZJ01007472.1/:471-770(+)